ncbi:MAG TPA: hypothetical protein VJR70_08720 [Stellaceae bacterium]|nr:hypothetical protein [Stellaceae bacterium]
MASAQIRIVERDLAAEMERMRVWLDSRRCEPAAFRYEHGEAGVVIHVEFAAAQEAEAFALAFGGQVQH